MQLKQSNISVLAVVAGVITLAVFLRALSCGFVNLDDPQYIYDNPAIRTLDLQFLREAFTTSYMGWWMPLTWISLAIDYALWGLNPLGFHLTNILLHAVNTGLVVLIAARLLSASAVGRVVTWLPLLAALLWGVHPLRVESVVWVTERKDVLNGLFSLGAILFYLRYAQSPPESASRRRWNYSLSLLFLLLSLMAKPVSVVLPALFLLIDWYPLGRTGKGGTARVIYEKIPFFLLAVALSVATLKFAAGETILVPLADYPLTSRLLVAGYALVEYVRMTVWPAGLTHFYPILPELPFAYYRNSLLAVALTVAAVAAHRRIPWLAACWAAFILPLLPVLGLLQNGAQSHADRFTYLPAILPGILLTAVAAAWLERVTERLPRYLLQTLVASLLLLLAVFATVSWRQIGFWRNSATLWSRLIEVKPVGRAYYYRGDYYRSIADYNAAAGDYSVAVQLAEAAGNPEAFNLYALRGESLQMAGRYGEAVDAFTAAINRYPSANYYYHRGVALRSLGRMAEAEADFRRGGKDTGPVEWQRVN